MDESIIPECYVDTNLLETLVPPNMGYNHQKGCGTVTKRMNERFANRFALGIIDKDKSEVRYLNEFALISGQGGLLLHKHETRFHYIIQINPAIEKFIISNAASVGVILEDFDLPSDFDLFRKESKTVTSKNDNRFKRLFKAIKNKNALDFQRLANWITYLKIENYHANVEVLQKM